MTVGPSSIIGWTLLDIFKDEAASLNQKCMHADTSSLESELFVRSQSLNRGLVAISNTIAHTIKVYDISLATWESGTVTACPVGTSQPLRILYTMLQDCLEGRVHVFLILHVRTN